MNSININLLVICNVLLLLFLQTDQMNKTQEVSKMNRLAELRLAFFIALRYARQKRGYIEVCKLTNTWQLFATEPINHTIPTQERFHLYKGVLIGQNAAYDAGILA